MLCKPEVILRGHLAIMGARGLTQTNCFVVVRLRRFYMSVLRDHVALLSILLGWPKRGSTNIKNLRQC